MTREDDDIVIETGGMRERGTFSCVIMPTVVDGEPTWTTPAKSQTAGEQRLELLQLQEEAVRSDEWLPDVLNVPVVGDDGREVHWFSIRTEIRLDAKSRPFVKIAGERFHVEPLGIRVDGKRDDLPVRERIKKIRERNRRADRSRKQSQQGIVRVPSSMASMVPGTLPSSMSMESRRVIVRDTAMMEVDDVIDALADRPGLSRTRVTVSWSDLHKKRLIELDEMAGKRRRARDPTATLFLERTVDTTEDQLWTAALDLLQHVSTDAVASLFACCVEAVERGNRFAVIPSTVAKHRGIDPARMSSKQRQSFRRHLELWTKAKIQIAPFGPGRPQRIRLFVPDRDIEHRGVGWVEVYRLHEDLWESMQQGKAWLFDRTALAFDMRTQELHWRIYSRLTGRLSINYGQNPQLRKSGGRMRVRLPDLLTDSGFDWKAVRKHRGEAALIERIESALTDLVNWRPRPLFAEATLIRNGRGIEAMEVEVVPPAVLIEAHWKPKARSSKKRPAKRIGQAG